MTDFKSYLEATHQTFHLVKKKKHTFGIAEEKPLVSKPFSIPLSSGLSFGL